MRIGRRSRRLAGCIGLVVATLIAWDQTGLATRYTGARVAGAVYQRTSLAGGFDSLDRLRVPDAAALATAAPELVEAPAPEAGEVAIAPPPEAFEAPSAPPPPPPVQLRTAQFDGVTPAGGTWAVMIGINDYPGVRYDLRSAVADVQDVNEALGRMGVPGQNRLLIRDGQATAGTIRAAADWLRAHAGPDAVAVFFYAGHVRKLGGGTEAIVASDGGLVSDADLASILQPMQAKRAWIGIAACYGGGFTEVLAPGRVLTAAAPSNEIAYENERFGRSYLVEYMVRRAMIENRASSSVEAAFAWAKAEIARDYPNRVPVQFDDDPAELDLRPPKPPAPATASGGSGSGSTGSGSGGTSPTAPPPPSASPPPPDPDDGCGQLTVGIVRCNG